LLTPTLAWEDALGETSYTIEIDSEPSFSPPLVYSNASIAADVTSFTVPSGLLLASTSYYWRALAVNGTGVTVAANAPFSFTTQSGGGGGSAWEVTSNPSTGDDQVYGLAVDSTGVYVIGSDSSPGNLQWRVEKRNLSDGSLATSFGTSGVVTANMSGDSDEAQAIAIDGSTMFIAGYDKASFDHQWHIERRSLSDGSLITSFGTSGVVTNNPSVDADIAQAVAVDGTGVYIAGFEGDAGGDKRWRIEKRNLTGGLIWAVTSNPNAVFGLEAAYGITVDATGVYIVGTQGSGGTDTQWRVEKRSLTTGTLITGFGTSGVVISDPSTGFDYANSVSLDASALYIVGLYEPGAGNTAWRVEKRNLTDGSLISTFGTAGAVTSNPSSGFDEAQAGVVDAGSLFLTGFDNSPGNWQWRIEKRNASDGSLTGSFGTGGVITSNPSTGLDLPKAIAVDASFVHIGGYDESNGSGNRQWRIRRSTK
jgi:hypothetical protein